MTDLFESFLAKISSQEHFSFSRYGDGEMGAILGREGKNCDGHEYFKDMGKALKDCLLTKQSGHIYGIQNHALRTMPDLPAWLAENGLDVERDFVNADVWHRASINGVFEQFFDAVRLKSILLVAPHDVAKLQVHNYWVEVPYVNCWKSKDAIMRGIDNYIDYVDIVLFCASMASNVMIHELHERCGGKKTILDMGSVFSPYVGIANRSYHKKILERLERK